MRLASLLTVLVLSLLLAVHRPVLAAASAPRVVAVVLAGSDADVARLGRLLAETLRAVPVQARTQRVERILPHRVSRTTSREANDVARLWLDCTEPNHARLYLTTPDASRIFVRDFTFDHGLDATALELLAFVSRNSISALLAGDEVGVAREEYERTLADRSDEAGTPAVPVQSAAPSEPRPSVADQAPPSEWHLAATYELEALRASTFEHGPGAALEWGSSALSVGLSAQARFPVQVGTGPIRARLLSRSARFFVARALRLSASASLSVSGALGLDWIRVEPEGSGDTASVTPNFSVTEALARLGAGFRYGLGALELGALTGLELGFVPARYRVLLASGAAEDVFSPWRLRPFGALSVGTHW